MKVLLIILLLVYAIGATRPPRIDVEDHPVQEHDSIGKFVELKEHQTIIFKCSGPHDDLEFKFPDMSDHKGYNEVTYLNRVEEVNDDDLGDRVLTITNVQQSDTGAYSCISLEHPSLNDTIYVFVHGENTFIPSIIAMLSYGDEDVMVPCRTTMFVDKNDIELYADGQLIKNAMKNYDHRFGYKIDKNIYDEKLSDTRFECKYKKEPNQRVFFLITKRETRPFSIDDYILSWDKSFEWPHVGYSNYTMGCRMTFAHPGDFPTFRMKIRIQCPRCDVNGVNKHIIVHNTTFDDRSNSLHSHMEIDSLELEDSGEYMCTLTFEGREETLETRTELHVAPQKAQIQVIERSPQILRVHEDKEIFLSAKFAMYPTDGESYVAKWSRRYNSSIKGGTQSETLINDKTHTISTKTFENGNVLESLTMNGTVKAFMSGTYVLSISLLDTVQVVRWEVAIENDRPDVQITVREPSSFIVFNQLFYPPDTHLHVDCISVSIPPADVVFEKKNSESSEFEEIGGDSLLRVDGTFEKGFVWNMTLDEVTELRCSSEKHGKKSTTTKKIIAAEEALHIVSDIKKSKKASKLEDPKLIYEGDHVQLACVVPIGAVDWDVTWNFVGSSSPETASLPVRIEPKGHSKHVILDLYDVTVGSTGKYVCVVKKDNSEELLEIVVDIEPTSKPYHTKADSRHVVNVEFDHDFELDCHMAGSPPPEYIWFKDGNHYTVGVQDGSVLKVTRARAEDDGQFHCLAMNRAGSTNHFMEVQVEGAPKGSSFYYKLSALIIFIFLVAVVFLVWKLRKTRRETKQKDIKLAELSSMLLSENVGPVPEELKELPIEERAYYLPYRKTEYEIDPNNLELLEVLGQGNFGVVRKGYLQMADPKSQIEYKTRLPVAVKSSIDPYNLAQQKMIAEELKVMCAIDKHPNVLALIGGVTANMRKGQLLIVTEYIDGGELRGLLRKNKASFINELVENEVSVDDSYMVPNSVTKKKYKFEKSSLETEKLLSDNNSNFFSTSDLLSFALQIANGMEFLARVPCVHRDLACRNILVTKTKIIRVADFGLAKKHSNKTYYRVKNIKDTQMPVRWMAPESLQNHTYTQKSDVWSFGICLYEIFSLGNLPYPNVINVVDVFDYIVQGHINSQPEYCHEEMYELMKLCWQSSPEDRPPFSACVQYLKSHMNNNAAELLARVDNMLHIESEEQHKLKDYIEKSRPDIPGATKIKKKSVKEQPEERYLIVESHA